ncbi:cytochrome P450 [Xylariaceae sp. FL1272]|nr:cytochrome P450 [Xylariaceae sp. FL1272]
MSVLPISALVLVAVATWLFIRFQKLRPLDSNATIPYVKFDGDNSAARYLSETGTLMEKGYVQYIKNGLPFSIRNPTNPNRPYVILPMKYLDEVRSAPDHVLSFPMFLEKANLLRDIGAPLMNSEVTHMARTELNRALDSLAPAMYDACLAAFQQAMPSCPDWTAIAPYNNILQIFSRITAPVLVGPDLGQDDDWNAVAIEYTNTCLGAIGGVRAKYHPSLRWLSRYTNPNVKAAAKVLRRAARILEPYLQAYEADEPTSQLHTENAIFWLTKLYRKRNIELTAHQLALDEMLLTVASIHSSAATALAALFDLVDRPESVAEIRDEMGRVGAKHGSWTRRALDELIILDSFMKESLRVHTVAHLTMQRYAVAPVVFKDGLRLQQGTQIGFANHQINLDSDLHPDAKTFMPKRALRQREELDPNRFHFASVSDDSLNFGSGLHACPGRFLAQQALKLMFIHLLANYDIKFADDSTTRPVAMQHNFSLMPNITSSLMFRERRF